MTLDTMPKALIAIALLAFLVYQTHNDAGAAAKRDRDPRKFTSVVSVDPYRPFGWKRTCTYAADGYRVSCYSWRLLKVSAWNSRPDVWPYYGYAETIHVP